MFKYIIKRLLISFVILFGVSVIIYTLVRLMPNDYIDVKFSAQLQSGSMKQEDVDRFKENYGLNMPDAFLSFKYKEESFVRSNAKHVAYEDLTEGYAAGAGNLSELENTLFRGTYVGEKTEIRLADNGKYTEREKDGVIPYASGSYRIAYQDGAFSLVLTPDGAGAETEVSVLYREANFFEKLGSILGGFFGWIGNLLKGDLGTSFKYKKPVAQVIGENMWISFAIAVIATILQFLIAIPLGISGATHQYSVRDYTVTVFTMIGISLPTYFFAAIVVKIFSVDLGWFPANGLIYASEHYTADFAGTMQKFLDIARHLVLPIFVSVILSIGGLMRYTRTNMLEVLNADYIRTARAKGLSEKKVIYKHAFRNTMIPLATLLAGILPSLFGGMMITEQVFGIDGIGRLAYQALREGDVPFVMGYNMFLAVLTIIGTLFSDIMYSIVDPRVKLGK